MLSPDEIKTEALRLGFDACGIAEACALPDDAAYLRHWLDAGYNAEMGYMANYFEKRTDVCQLFEGAKSVIVVLLGYYPARLQPKDAPQVAKYAYGTDYHFVIKEKLRKLQQFIDQRAEQCCQICVDSAPMLERRWAQRAGLGWIGKSGLLVNPTLGSYTLIGEIITTLPLTYDTPTESRCGRCTRCLEACPTGALVAEHTLDARRCISYITIEQRAELTLEQRQMCGNRIFGCDACLDACPWNQHPKPHHTEEFTPSDEFFTLDWSSLTNAQFRHIFKHSPLQRAGFKKISNFKFQISDYA